MQGCLLKYGCLRLHVAVEESGVRERLQGFENWLDQRDNFTAGEPRRHFGALMDDRHQADRHPLRARPIRLFAPVSQSPHVVKPRIM